MEIREGGSNKRGKGKGRGRGRRSERGLGRKEREGCQPLPNKNPACGPAATPTVSTEKLGPPLLLIWVCLCNEKSAYGM
jgi:hypothetical protein